MITAEHLVNNASAFATLPDIYHRIDDAINDPNTSYDTVAKIISEDIVLSARLLKIVNSPSFGFPSQIDTIARAMSIVGTKQLCNMVLATTVVGMFRNIEHIDMKSFWHHSIACGIASRVIATFRRESNVERYYTAGLLHDIGKLVIYSELPAETNHMFDDSIKNDMLVLECEQNILNFTHVDVAYFLLKQWNLPEAIVEAISYHHNPGESKNYPVEAAVVHIADLLVNAMSLGSSGERYVPKLDIKAWECLKLDGKNIEDIVECIEHHYHDAVELFIS